MEYITDCLRSSIMYIIVCVVLFISVFIGYKMKKIGKKEVIIILFFTCIFMIPNAFLDFKFYYEYHNNPKIQDTIEIKSIESKTKRYFSRYNRHRDANIQFLHSMDSRKFLLADTFDIGNFVSEQEEELLDLIKRMREDGALSDLADNYIAQQEAQQEGSIRKGDKYRITYVKTARYDVIMEMERVQE